jgi:uncharacterized protein YcaQ
MTVSWRRALAWRMERQHLVERAPQSDLLRVVGDICGLHAQLMSSAELSLWARIDGLEREALHEALWNDRTLVKLWAMRGTLHVLLSAELGVWLAALSTYTNRGMTGHPEVDALTEAVAEALEGRILSREELAAAVEEVTGDASVAELIRSSWGSYLKPASFRGRLCFAPSDDGRVRMTSPATWLRAPIARPDPADALGEVGHRFLSAYAPATLDDLAIWSGFGRARVRRILAELGDEAVEIDVGRERGWALAEDLDAIANAEAPDVARLLPAFDPWVAGASRTAKAFIDPRYRARVYRPQGWFSPVILVNGRMVGVWKHARKSRRLVVELEPFRRLPAWARAQLEAEADRLAAFLDGQLEFRVRRPA